ILIRLADNLLSFSFVAFIVVFSKYPIVGLVYFSVRISNIPLNPNQADNTKYAGENSHTSKKEYLGLAGRSSFFYEKVSSAEERSINSKDVGCYYPLLPLQRL